MSSDRRVTAVSIKKEQFGVTPDGQCVDSYTCTNRHGVELKIITYGGIVTSLKLPGCDNCVRDVVLGYDTLEEYIDDKCYFGGIVGRYANRIAKGKFTLNGKKYALPVNSGQDHLHGGIRGFNKVLWKAEQPGQRPGLRLSYLSKDSEEGYPGNLSCTVDYELTDDNELAIRYFAQTDKDTIVNLTNHSYFNLAGHSSGNVLNHELLLNAEYWTVTDEQHIPTGKIESVKDTALDFMTATAIGARIDQVGAGYDHNYIIGQTNGSLTLVGSVYEASSGNRMEVFTTQPGVQFYTGNFLNGEKGKGGAIYNKHAGFCLETQHFPDSPNKHGFPSVILKAEDEYEHLAIYKFFPPNIK
jgi:aldose 1-epimerase